MITSDDEITPNLEEEVKKSMSGDVNVVLLTDIGAEGLNFPEFRQIHIVQPPHNASMLEQIVARVFRLKSHKNLPFAERNVQIFMHATVTDNLETPDLFLYRLCAEKVDRIGSIMRILKEEAIDSRLNRKQWIFSRKKMNTTVTQKISSPLSATKAAVRVPVGDLPYSMITDYKENPITLSRPLSPSHSSSPDKQSQELSSTLNSALEQKIQVPLQYKLKLIFKDQYTYEIHSLFQKLKETAFPFLKLSHLRKTIQQINRTRTIFYDRYQTPGFIYIINQHVFFRPLSGGKNKLHKNNKPVFYRVIPS